MNRKLRKRKIKNLTKISSAIPGDSWNSYEEILKRRMDKWNWKSYSTKDLDAYGLDTPEQKKEANIRALMNIRLEFVDYYILLKGLSYSEYSYKKIEQEAYQAYKDWYADLLVREGKPAISPLKALYLLRDEVEEFRQGDFIQDVDEEIVKGYEFDSIEFDINCDIYRRYLSSEYSAVKQSEFINILDSGLSSYPVIKYICFNDILYKVVDFSNIEEKYSRYGKIQCSVHIPYNNLSIVRYIAQNSTLNLVNNEKGSYLDLDLTEKSDYAFVLSWINKIVNARVRALAPNSIYYPEDWIISKIRTEILSKKNTILIGGSMGVGTSEVFDIKKTYEGAEPIIFFEKDSGDRITIMSDEKISYNNKYQISTMISSLAEKAEVIFQGAGMASSNPFILALSLVSTAADIGASYMAASYAEDLNAIDVRKLREKERKFIMDTVNLKEEIEKSQSVKDSISSEYGFQASTLAILSVGLDVSNDRIGDEVARNISNPANIASTAKLVSKGLQFISFAITLYDAVSAEEIEKTEEMKAAERKVRVIVDQARVLD